MSQTTTALPTAEAAALETLYDALLRAQHALASVQSRIADGGKLQRLGPGVWLVTRDVPDAPEGGAA